MSKTVARAVCCQKSGLIVTRTSGTPALSWAKVWENNGAMCHNEKIPFAAQVFAREKRAREIRRNSLNRTH